MTLKKMIELRDYQIEMLDRLQRTWREGKRSVMVQMPTGTGKTVVMGAVIKESLSPDPSPVREGGRLARSGGESGELENEEIRKLEDEEIRKLEDEEIRKLENEEIRKLEDEEIRKLEDEESRELENEKIRKLEDEEIRKLEN